MCKCTKCGVEKVRTPIQGKGYYTTYVDEAGKVWNRLTCPPCMTLHRRASYQATKAGEIKTTRKYERAVPPSRIYKAYFAPDAKFKPCAECKSPTVNYKYCPPCHSIYVSSLDGAEEYTVGGYNGR